MLLFYVSLAYYLMTGQMTGGVMNAIIFNKLRMDSDVSKNSSRPYTIDKPNLCYNTNHSLSLLIMVVTAPNNMETRMTIRRTWGTVKLNPDVRLLFVLGNTADDESQSRLLAEDSTYNDLVQGRFHDDYYNLTRKSVFILDWAHQWCANARRVVKIDDDCFLNIPNLRRFLSAKKENSAIYGRVLNNVKPIRDKNNKWWVSKNSFPEDVFPSYMGGPSYVITSGAAIQALLNVINSDKKARLSLEDVYVTGLCAEKASVARINDDNFNIALSPNICDILDVITYHTVSTDQMYFLWWVANDRKLERQCMSKEKHQSFAAITNTIITNLYS